MKAESLTREATTLVALSRAGRRLLADAGVEHAEQEVVWILEAALGCTRLDVFLNGRLDVSLTQWERAMALLRRRAGREPLQYLLGTQEFCGREFTVGPSVLIPRPETELLVEEVRRCCEGLVHPVIADIGTGSGCIAVSLALDMPEATVYATDVSRAALEVARINARRHGVEDRVTFREGDLVEPLKMLGCDGHLTAVVSNPPYIPEQELAGLQPEVQRFEPRRALAGGQDGFAVLRRLIAEGGRCLKPGGILAMEVGCGQAEYLMQLAREDTLYSDVWSQFDQLGVERVVCLRRRA